MPKRCRRSLAPMSLAGVLGPPLLAHGASFFPLEKGHSWRYITENLSSDRRIEVLDRTGDVVQAAMWFESVVLVDHGTEVDLEVPEEGYALFYRFVADSTWEHRDPRAVESAPRPIAASTLPAVTAVDPRTAAELVVVVATQCRPSRSEVL